MVDVYVGYLRAKVDRPFGRKLIHTRRGQGYVLRAEGEEGGGGVTRRIAWAILLTAWATLLLGGAAAYVAVRGTLLAELDRSVVDRGGGAAGRARYRRWRRRHAGPCRREIAT